MRISKIFDPYKTHAELIENVIDLSGYDLDELSWRLEIPVEKLRAVMRGCEELNERQKTDFVRYYIYYLKFKNTNDK